jgi:hypothetical protein
VLFALVQVTPAGVVTGSAYVNTGDGAWLPLTRSVRGTTVKLVVQCSGGGGSAPMNFTGTVSAVGVWAAVGMRQSGLGAVEHGKCSGTEPPLPPLCETFRLRCSPPNPKTKCRVR